MRKMLAVAAAVLLLAGVGAAADRHGPLKTGKVILAWDTVEGDAGNHPSTVTVIDVETAVTISPGGDGEDTVTLGVTDDRGASAEETYRHGNEAPQEKKLRGRPSFDDLEMERGVKPGATELHDWIKDIQAGKADEGRKEIAVIILDYVPPDLDASVVEDIINGNAVPMRARENGRKTVRPEDLVALATGHGGDVRVLAIDVDNAANEVARDGRNPQTGEEIQLPARTVEFDIDGDGDYDLTVTVTVTNTGDEEATQTIRIRLDQPIQGEVTFKPGKGLTEPVR